MDWTEQRDRLLTGLPHHPSALLARPVPGIYAWWDEQASLDEFWPDELPPIDPSRPIYVGIAKTTLAERGGEMHLKATRMSSLRRSLTALLADKLKLHEGLVAAPKQKFSLSKENEALLTYWINTSLTVTWVEMDQPGTVERPIVADLLPPLNDTYAHAGPYWKHMRKLRAKVRLSGTPARS